MRKIYFLLCPQIPVSIFILSRYVETGLRRWDFGSTKPMSLQSRRGSGAVDVPTGRSGRPVPFCPGTDALDGGMCFRPLKDTDRAYANSFTHRSMAASRYAPH
jgi:hypothetical protein